MERNKDVSLQSYKKARSALDDYGRIKQIYNKYLELRRQIGKSPRELMDIEEMERSLKSMGAAKSK